MGCIKKASFAVCANLLMYAKANLNDNLPTFSFFLLLFLRCWFLLAQNSKHLISAAFFVVVVYSPFGRLIFESTSFFSPTALACLNWMCHADRYRVCVRFKTRRTLSCTSIALYSHAFRGICQAETTTNENRRVKVNSFKTSWLRIVRIAD